MIKNCPSCGSHLIRMIQDSQYRCNRCKKRWMIKEI